MNTTAPFDAIISAPIFSIGVHCDESVIYEIVYLPLQPEQAPRNLLAAEAVKQLQAWLQDPHFVFDLPLASRGTPHQKRVWAAISAIPIGKTCSYGDIAQSIRSAPRAVGGACGANPFPVVVPCHRVIARDGGIGGFAKQRDGLLLDIKRWLLQHESPHSNPRPEGEGDTGSLRSPLKI